MITAPSAFRDALGAGNRNYQVLATVTLTSGSVLTLDNSVIWASGFSFEDAISTSADTLDIGAAIINQATLVISNMDEQFSDYDFDGAIVAVQIGLRPDEDSSVSYINKGTFTVGKTAYNGTLITLTCLDNMSKFDKAYASPLTFPTTAITVVQDACQACGVTLAVNSFDGDTTSIPQPPAEAVTYRQMLAWIGQMVGCCWRINNVGELAPVWYNISVLDQFYADGGTFAYDNGDEYDGGTFAYDDGDSLDGGTFAQQAAYFSIHSASSESVAVDDTIVTGIKIIVANTAEDAATAVSEYITGTDGYVLTIEGNPLINADNVSAILSALGSRLIGMTYRKGMVSHINDPRLEAGDVFVFTDHKGHVYPMICSQTDFTVGEYQHTTSASETPARNSAQRYSEATRNTVKIFDAVGREKNARETAVKDLQDQIDNAPGLYMTTQTEAGATVYLLHNKPTVAASDIIWKMSSAAVGVSTNGGQSYNAGLTADGTAIVQRLYANAVTAGILKSVDYQPPTTATTPYTAQGMIVDLDNKVIRTPKTAILSDGSIYSSSVDLEGKITATSGSIGPWTISDTAIYNGMHGPNVNTSGTYIGTNGIAVRVANQGKFSLEPGGNLLLVDETADDGTTGVLINIQKTSAYGSSTHSYSNITFSSHGLTTAYLGTYVSDDNPPKISGVFTITSNTGNELRYDSELGRLVLRGNTSESRALDSTNPQIVFQNRNATQNGALIWNDFDTVQSPASLTLAGNQGGEYFIAPNIKATSGLYIGTASVANSITGITRSGTTFTATRLDGTTFTFTQQDNNTTYTAGTGLTLSGTQFNLSDNELAYRQYAKTVSTDFNGITAPGIYVLDGTTMTNAPSGYTWSKLIVLMESGWGQQIVSGNNFIYQRGFTGSPGAWSAWRRVDTSVKGNAETTYRSGDVNLTPANIGALALTGGTLTGNLILNNNIYIYSKDSGGTSRVLVALTDMDGFCYGYGSKAGSVGVSYFDGHVVYIRSNGAINMQCASASINAALTVTGTITGYDYSGSSHVMVGSASDASHRVGYLYHQNPTTVRVYGQGGGSGYTTYTTLTGTSSSDIRLKEHIKGTEVNALSLIRQIEMRAFDWKPGWRDYTHQPIGMIADQIEKLDNRLVIGGGYDPDGEPNYKVIDDHYLACYLTKGVQELCDRIEMLEHEIKKLKGAA